LPKFIAVHVPFPAPVSTEQAAPLLKRLAAAMTAEAYWRTSWCQANAEGKVVKAWCAWDATSAEAVRKAAEKYLPEMPLEGVYPLLVLDSGDFR